MISDILKTRGWSSPSILNKHSWEKIIQRNNEAFTHILNIVDDDHLDEKKKNENIFKISDQMREFWASVITLLETNEENEAESFIDFFKSDLRDIDDGLITEEQKSDIFSRKKIFERLEERGWKPANIHHLVMSLITLKKWQELDALGIDAMEPLSFTILEDDFEFKIAAINSFAKIKDNRVIDELLIADMTDNSELFNAAEKGLKLFLFPEWVDHLIDLLITDDLHIITKVIEMLGNIGDSKALESLFEKKKLYFKSKPKEYCMNSNVKSILEEAIEKIENNNKFNTRYTVCNRCMMRYTIHSIMTGVFSSYEYYSCPSCHSNMYSENGIDRIRLVMDRALKESFFRQDEILIVNWFKFNQPLDYDEIVIRNGNDIDVEELVLKLVNDTNEKRCEKMKQVPVYVDPKAKLSMSKMNLLKDYFSI